MSKSVKQPPTVVLEYRYPNGSSLRVRVVQRVNDAGEVGFQYEQATELDAMDQPRWIDADAAVTRGTEKHEIIARRVVDLIGGVLSGKIKAAP